MRASDLRDSLRFYVPQTENELGVSDAKRTETMKVVINTCFGGFSLSAQAVARLAELKGRPCYFFKRNIRNGFSAKAEPISVEQANDEFMFFAYDVPNPDDVLRSQDDWHSMTTEERQASNKSHDEHSHETRPSNRSDPDLVRVVEELGAAANGSHAELKVVDIPDGTEYEIDEYDGNEHIAEVHQTWR